MTRINIDLCPSWDCDGKELQLKGPDVGYCDECSRIFFRCPKGHWNRDFARYCIQCGVLLNSTISWPMAHHDQARNSSVSLRGNHYCIENLMDDDKILSSWAVKFSPPFEERHCTDLPSPVTVPGLIIVPSPNSNEFVAYGIVDQRVKWQARYADRLSYTSSPVVMGLYMYSITRGSILKTSLLDGTSEAILENPEIEPAERCAPLGTYRTGHGGEEAILVFGLKQHLLILSPQNGRYRFVELSGMDRGHPDSVWTPVVYRNEIVATTKYGKVYCASLENEREQKVQPVELEGYLLSAPVVLGEAVLFHTVDVATDERWIVRYSPGHRKIEKIQKLADRVLNIENFTADLRYPPAVCEDRAFISDYFGHCVYIVDARGVLKTVHFMNATLVSRMATVVGKRVYFASESGLLVYDPLSDTWTTVSLVETVADKVFPVFQPIVYANRLFVMCKDRLVWVPSSLSRGV